MVTYTLSGLKRKRVKRRRSRSGLKGLKNDTITGKTQITIYRTMELVRAVNAIETEGNFCGVQIHPLWILMKDTRFAHFK